MAHPGTGRPGKSGGLERPLSFHALYGEADGNTDPEFVHIEDIATRSRLYEWNITPHRHPGMFQIVVLLSGTAEILVDEQHHHVSAPFSVSIPGGVVHGFSFEPDTEGYVLTVSDLLFLDARYKRSRKLFEPLLQRPLCLSLADNPRAASTLTILLDQLTEEFHTRQTGRMFMFEWAIRMVMMTLRRHLDQTGESTTPTSERQEALARFRQLIEDHFRDHWTVTRYADELAMSQATLNRLCKSLSGKGAGDLIADRLVLEARRYLIYTSATVAMIGYELGFQDPAYFSRFFRKKTGIAPGKYRENELDSRVKPEQPESGCGDVIHAKTNG